MISAVLTHDGLGLVAGPQIAVLVYEAVAATGATVTLPQTPLPNGVLTVAINGQIQQAPRDYTITGATLTFTPALSADDIHIEYQVSAYNPSIVSSHFETTLTTGQNTITLPVAPVSLPLVTRDGVVQYQSAGHFSLAGTIITLTEPIATGEGGRISVDYTAGGIAAAPNADTVDFFNAYAASSPQPSSLVALDANGRFPPSVFPAQTTAIHEEFMPANAATTVTLSQAPGVVLTVTRDGVVQSVNDNHYSLSGAVLTFTDAFDGLSRVTVTYLLGAAIGAASTVGGISAYAASSAPQYNALIATGSDGKLPAVVEHNLSNLLTNGGFEFWQRGTGPFTTSVNGPDRWLLSIGSGSTMSVSRDTSNMDSSSQYCAAITYTNSNPSYFFHSSGTGPENPQQFAGKPMSFSIRVRCSVANAIQLAYYDVGWNLGRFNTGAAGYETLTMTFTPVAGLNQVAVGIQLRASCTVYVDNAMLVLSSTPFDYVPLHPADDYHRCQRYYEEVGPAATGTLICRIAAPTTGTYYADLCVRWQARKPVAPTTTKNGTWSVSNCSQPSIANNSVDGARIEASTGGAVGDAYAYNAAAGCNFTVEANP